MVVSIMANKATRRRIAPCDNKHLHFLKEVHKGAKLAQFLTRIHQQSPRRL